MEKQKKGCVLLAAPKSGSGKTTVVCGLIQALQMRGCKIGALKCGPDYIDGMFHRQIFGVETGNVDGMFSKVSDCQNKINSFLQRGELVLVEGVMGYYDGIGFTTEGSSYALSKSCQIPTVLVLDCKGAGCSIGAMLQGFLTYKESMLRGVIFNRLPEKLYEPAAELARELGLEPLGYLPNNQAFSLDSRKLGLVIPEQADKLQEKLRLLGKQVEKTIDLDRLMALAETYPVLSPPTKPQEKMSDSETRHPLRLAVAKDEAFCFLYEDNIRLLEEKGFEPVYFSPLREEKLPDQVAGLYLPGGYPELFLEQLSQNKTLQQQLRQCFVDKMPMIAECGGYMYLQEGISDEEGRVFPMTGIFEGVARPSERLQHFGYARLKAKQDTLLLEKDAELLIHEFHYFISDKEGVDYQAQKVGKPELTWAAGYGGAWYYAAYGHLYFETEPKMLDRLYQACEKWRKQGS